MMRTCLAILVAALPLAAYESGLPVGHTGAFGQPSCSTAGCHRLEPSPPTNTATVRIEVAPYAPGVSQQVRVIIESAFATRWGFQLTARRQGGAGGSVGTFEAGNTPFVAVRCSNGSFAPCASNDPQYATHTSSGTNAGGPAQRQSYAFTWNPPASDAGPIEFAAAALAANNDRGTNGDFTATATTTALPSATSSPRISTDRGVLHAGALSHSPQRVAPKQLLSIFGTHLNPPGSFIQVGVPDFDVDGFLPTELGRLSVEFATPGDPNVRLGRMLFVSENQVNLQAPDFPVGAPNLVRIQVVLNRGKGASELRSNVVEMPIQRFTPGLFAFGNLTNGFAPGQGPAAAVNNATGQIVAPPAAGVPGSILAKPGDIVLLYGTGFGPTTAQPGQEAALEHISGVSATIGGAAADVLYAGTAPSYVGLQQFNLRVPNLPPGNHAVSLRLGTFTTQGEVFLSVGP